MLQADEDAFHIHLHHAVEDIVGIFMQRRYDAFDPGIVGKDADRSESTLDGIYKMRDLLCVRDVGPKSPRLATVCLHEARRQRGRLLVDIDDCDRLAHPPQPQRDGTTDIAATASAEG